MTICKHIIFKIERSVYNNFRKETLFLIFFFILFKYVLNCSLFLLSCENLNQQFWKHWHIKLLRLPQYNFKNPALTEINNGDSDFLKCEE